MRMEISDLEHHELFTSHIKKIRHESEELVKMLECRIEALTKPLCDIDLNNSAYKSMRLEAFRAIDAAEGLIRLLYKRLNENMEKSFLRIEEGEEGRDVH